MPKKIWLTTTHAFWKEYTAADADSGKDELNSFRTTIRFFWFCQGWLQDQYQNFMVRLMQSPFERLQLVCFHSNTQYTFKIFFYRYSPLSSLPCPSWLFVRLLRWSWPNWAWVFLLCWPWCVTSGVQLWLAFVLLLPISLLTSRRSAPSVVPALWLQWGGLGVVDPGCPALLVDISTFCQAEVVDIFSILPHFVSPLFSVFCARKTL